LPLHESPYHAMEGGHEINIATMVKLVCFELTQYTLLRGMGERISK
jgi:hypothetical protein